MKTNVFWGIVGGIVLVWLILLGVVIYPKWNTYSEKKAKVTSAVSKLSKLAKREESELPTEQLLDRVSKRVENHEANLQSARQWYQARDDRFEDTQSQDNLAVWTSVVYEGGFVELEKQYRQAMGLEADAKVPFDRLKNMNKEEDLKLYQKQWNVQRTVIQKVIAHGGDVVKYDKKEKPDLKLGLQHPDFTSIQSTANIWLPPGKIAAYVNELLNDDTINVSLVDLVVTKARNSLVYDLVEALPEGKEPMGEPMVRCLITFDVQDWSPRPEESTETE